jgi:hypothetical protein
VLSKTEELRAKLSTVTAAKSTAALAKPIRAEIAELECTRMELLATIGREAYETGHGSDVLRAKIKVCDELGDACRDRLNELGVSEDVDSRAIRTPLVMTGVGLGLLTTSILAVCVLTIPRQGETPAVEPSVAEMGITDVPPTDINEIDPFATDMEDTEPAADVRNESQPLRLADEKASSSSSSSSMSVEERDEPKVATFDPTPWARATLLLVNPAHYAVGMTKPTSDLYEVVAKATEAEAEQAIEYGRSQGLPILGLDPALAREVYARYQPGDRLSTSHSDKVHGFFRPRQFGPAEDNLIAFRDVRNGSWQVGQVSEDSSSFHPLLEPEPQTFKAEYILPGSMRGMSKQELCDWKQIDFVDYCAFQIAKHVSTKDDERYVAVALKEVKLDIDPNELNDMRQMDDREWQRYMQVQNLTHADIEVRVGLLATLFGGMSDNAARKERETKLERDRREREEIERAFRQIKRFEDSLQGELRKKLAQLEIPLLERESTQDLRDERELADDPEFRGRTESNFVSMYCASHMVLANIRWPQSGGSYELDVRLVDVRTGAIVWSDQRDRKFSKDMEPEVTALRCSLRTGRLARVDFVGSSSRSADLMSVPLGAPQLLATDASVTARPPALLHIEQASDSSSILLRDLFANERVEWPRSELQLSPVSDSFKDVPSGHEMRYLLWRTSSAIIPAGGRILQVDGSTARVGLGKQHGISPTDRLGVVRFTQLESGEIQQNPLSVELVVSTVDETQCSASVQSITNVQLGDNDVAVPKKGQRLKVAVIDPEFRLTDPKLQITANRLNRAQQQRLYQFTVQNGATLAAKFRAGLTKLQVPIVLAEDLPQDFRGGAGDKAFWDAKSASETARQANASHLLVGTISPTQTTVPCTCVLQLAVIDAASGEFVERFQVELNRSQLENLAHWSP